MLLLRRAGAAHVVGNARRGRCARRALVVDTDGGDGGRLHALDGRAGDLLRCAGAVGRGLCGRQRGTGHLGRAIVGVQRGLVGGGVIGDGAELVTVRRRRSGVDQSQGDSSTEQGRMGIETGHVGITY